jgi:hypothetical protein
MFGTCICRAVLAASGLPDRSINARSSSPAISSASLTRGAAHRRREASTAPASSTSSTAVSASSCPGRRSGRWRSAARSARGPEAGRPALLLRVESRRPLSRPRPVHPRPAHGNAGHGGESGRSLVQQQLRRSPARDPAAGRRRWSKSSGLAASSHPRSSLRWSLHAAMDRAPRDRDRGLARTGSRWRSCARPSPLGSR